MIKIKKFIKSTEKSKILTVFEMGVVFLLPAVMTKWMKPIELRKYAGTADFSRRKKYYQVSQTLMDEKVRERELAPLKAISDNYEKTVLSMDKTHITNYEVIKLGISDRATALMRTTIKKRPVVCGIIIADGGAFLCLGM